MIRAIIGKELRVIFASPLAWLLLAFFQLVLGWIFLSRLNYFLQIAPQVATMPAAPGATEIVCAPVFGTAAVILLMIVPLLSMRLIAEERRNQTLPFLFSAPVSVTQIVLGKFLALCAFLMLPVLLLAAMSLSLYLGGRVDLGLLAANVVGLGLLVSAFAGVGLLVSCMTAQPLVAAVGTFAVLLGLWLVDISATDPESPLHVLSLIRHYESFGRGILAVPDLAYYGALIVLCLLLSVRRLDAERLR